MCINVYQCVSAQLSFADSSHIQNQHRDAGRQSPSPVRRVVGTPQSNPGIQDSLPAPLTSILGYGQVTGGLQEGYGKVGGRGGGGEGPVQASRGAHDGEICLQIDEESSRWTPDGVIFTNMRAKSSIVELDAWPPERAGGGGGGAGAAAGGGGVSWHTPAGAALPPSRAELPVPARPKVFI
jgi:hypothetical protein